MDTKKRATIEISYYQEDHNGINTEDYISRELFWMQQEGYLSTYSIQKEGNSHDRKGIRN